MRRLTPGEKGFAAGVVVAAAILVLTLVFWSAS